jgi:hypothetical protein
VRAIASIFVCHRGMTRRFVVPVRVMSIQHFDVLCSAGHGSRAVSGLSAVPPPLAVLQLYASMKTGRCNLLLRD